MQTTRRPEGRVSSLPRHSLLNRLAWTLNAEIVDRKFLFRHARGSISEPGYARLRQALLRRRPPVCDVFEEIDGVRPRSATIFESWLQRRGHAAAGLCAAVWHPGADDGAALIDCLERHELLDGTLVVAITLPHRAFGPAPGWPGFVPATLAVRPPAGRPPVRLIAGPAGPADLLPTVLDLLPDVGHVVIAGRPP